VQKKHHYPGYGPHKIVMTCTEVRGGECPLGHKVGDRIEFVDWKVKGYICPTAFVGIYPYIRTMVFGHVGEMDVCCSDPRSLVVFKLKREVPKLEEK